MFFFQIELMFYFIGARHRHLLHYWHFNREMSKTLTEVSPKGPLAPTQRMKLNIFQSATISQNNWWVHARWIFVVQRWSRRWAPVYMFNLCIWKSKGGLGGKWDMGEKVKDRVRGRWIFRGHYFFLKKPKSPRGWEKSGHPGSDHARNLEHHLNFEQFTVLKSLLNFGRFSILFFLG